MNREFNNQLINTGYIHRPLPINEDKSLENRLKNKEIINSIIILDKTNNKLDDWKHKGVGRINILENGNLEMSSPTIMDKWPEGAAQDGDYTNFGTVYATKSFNNEDWTDYNRVKMYVYPKFNGIANPYMMISFRNEGVVKVPDIYFREGVHGVNMKNEQWNEVVFEIEDLPRDEITEITFSYYLNGKDRLTGNEMSLIIGDVFLEKVENPEISKGWLSKDNSIVYSHAGYSHQSIKTAFISSKCKEKEFIIKCSETNETAYKGFLKELENDLGKFLIADFTELEEIGSYVLYIGHNYTQEFRIDKSLKVWNNSLWKCLNFVFCERCGYPVPGIHTTCHADIVAEHKGQIISFNGGWHDAGDVSQQLIQSAEVTMALFEVADDVMKDKDLYWRIIEEGEWGLDFILKTRFGDGYRATSAGITRWTDGLIGGMDDEKARVHNQAYENFYMSGIEAFIQSRVSHNPNMSNHLAKIAKEDFQFALEEFEKHGIKQKPIFWEHTYQTSESLYYATASWSASMLYKITKDEMYANKAQQWIQEVLNCQEVDGIEDSTNDIVYNGFFYRNKDKKVIQHFNHQAREHIYLLALEAVIETQPNNDEYEKWIESVRMYGEYLKHIKRCTSPYPMIAAGLYHKDEYLDDESFNEQHLLTDERARDEYQIQFKEGIKVGENHSLRRFPIWFSFKGNNAIILSIGKAAAIASKLLNDNELREIAEGQLHWIIGKNPFTQSMMYGEGENYAQQYSVLCGEIVGEIPVGVQTFVDEDLPYWPQLNNATYKEVWVGNAGKWMSLVSQLNK